MKQMKMNSQFILMSPLEYGDLWNDRRDGKWKPLEVCHEGDGSQYGDFVGMRSYKAAKRHLRKHDEIPVGTKFLLSSRWVGFDRVLVKK